MPDCIFCKIVKGELPSFKIHEDEKTIAFLDIRPVNPGHTLVIPKSHSKNIFDVGAEDWAAVSETVRKVAHAVEKHFAEPLMPNLLAIHCEAICGGKLA